MRHARAATVGTCLALLIAGCTARPLAIPFDMLPDLSVFDLVRPPDFIPPDFTAPPDLTRPKYCNGIFVFDTDHELSFFDPTQLLFHDIAKLSCSTPAGVEPFSMAVGRDGTAWVEYTSGNLFTVNTDTGACAPTGFVPGQSGFTTFGMGFASDFAGSTQETLYLASDPVGAQGAQLGSLDLISLKVNPIGPVSGRAELTGTGAGELWGFFADAVSRFGRLDKTTAVLNPSFSLPQVGDLTQAGFAFGFFGGVFYVFEYDASTNATTSVYLLNPTDGSATKVVSNTGRHIVGAGVSTCAPQN